MLEPLYEKVIEKKSNITQFMTNVYKNIDTKKVNDIYIEYEFSSNKQGKKYVALDGSYNLMKYVGFFIYAISSQGILSDPEKGIEKVSPAGDIDIISSIYTRVIDNILSQHMNILELKSSIDILKKHQDIDYLLIDGSIRGTLMNTNTSFESSSHGLNRDILKKLKDISKDRIKELVTCKDIKIQVSLLNKIEELNDILVEVNKFIKVKDINSIKEDIFKYSEILEQLDCIYILLKNYNKKIVCISKTSNTKDIFNETIPDSSIIEYFCKNSGYTQINHIQNSKLIRSENDKIIKVNYPVHDLFFSDIEFTVLFVRFEYNSNVLKIELPYKASEEEVLKVLNELKSTCIKGYPYILRKAHEEVVIKDKNMDKIISMLNIRAKTGRDMLNK